MNISMKQHLLDKVLTFIRVQGVGNKTMYCSKSKKMCALGYLYSDLYGKDRLVNKKQSVIDSFTAGLDIENCLHRVYKENDLRLDEDAIEFLRNLQCAHDMARDINPLIDPTLEFKVIEIFEQNMKSIANTYNLSYNIPTVLQFKNKEREVPFEQDQEENLPLAA